MWENHVSSPKNQYGRKINAQELFMISTLVHILFLVRGLELMLNVVLIFYFFI